MVRSRAFHLLLGSLMLLGTVQCLSPQPTQYESTEDNIQVSRAPAGTRRARVALINFRNLTGQSFLVSPATAQLTSLMLQSGYFDIIEPSLVESVIADQSQVTEEKLQTLRDRYGAEYFLTGTLTNFEIRKTSSGFCLLLGLLGSSRTEEYIVETGIDYRLVGVPGANIIAANSVENRRTDTSEAAGLLFAHSEQSTRVLESSGGKLLRYAMRAVVEDIIAQLPGS